jgi:hypothetical protein
VVRFFGRSPDCDERFLPYDRANIGNIPSFAFPSLSA